MKHGAWRGSIASFSLLAGCATCPPGPSEDATVLAIVENGSWHDACAYEVRFQGSGSPADCAVVGLDCQCHGALVGDEVEISLFGISPTGLQSEIASTVLVADAQNCSDEPVQAVFERPPIEEFLRPGCSEAATHLDDCDFEGIIPPDECVDTTAEPGSLAQAERFSSYYACFTNSSCSTASATFCQPEGTASGVTSLIECLATALELDGDQTVELAEGAVSTCPE